MKTMGLVFCLFLAACSSSSYKVDYEVRNASAKERPEWISDSEKWAKDNDQDVEKYRYFAYETTPKVNRSVACQLAKTKSRADIADEIASFIQKTLGESQEGRASIDENNPETTALREFVEVTLAQKTSAMIHGASVIKTYWEKRNYLEEKGAKKDYVGYTCASLIRMSEKSLSKAIDRASRLLTNRVDDPETKANVKKAIKNVSEDFIKAKKGLI